MASDDVNNDDKNEMAERAERASERARQAAQDALDADHKAEDAALEAEYDASHSSASEVHDVAHSTSAQAAKAHEAAEQAEDAAHEAKELAREAETAALEGDEQAATEAATGAEKAADRAEKASAEAKAAADAAMQGGRATDAAKIAADAKRGYGEHDVQEDVVHPEKRPALYLAEFDAPAACMFAARRVRNAGYEKWDVHTPYPVHGMEQAMGLKETRLGWISMAAGMLGVATAFFMMFFMNGSSWTLPGNFTGYPIIVGGKPPGAFPSMVPIMFELGILLCGFGTLLGMFGLTRLPRHHHPVFESERFAAASDDKFFISIEAGDPKFDLDDTRHLLESLNPTHLELVEEEVS